MKFQILVISMITTGWRTTVRSRTKTDQVDVPLIDHEKERSVVNPRGPLRFISLFLFDHCYVILEMSNAF